MDRLRKYNQKLLAIIGTTVIVAVSLSLLLGLGGLIVSLVDRSGDGDPGLKVRDTSGTSDKILTRIQQVSFMAPVQLDTAYTDFLIPVGQVNLQSEEKVTPGVGYGMAFSGYGIPAYYGLFNNFILFEYKTRERTKIFSEKVSLTSWSYVHAGGTRVLLFMGTKDDTNRDNVLDGDDYQCLYAFYLEDKKLVEYNREEMTVLGYEPMNKTDMVAIRLGVDKDKDREFEPDTEPQEIAILNVNSGKLSPLVLREMKAVLQGTIDR